MKRTAAVLLLLAASISCVAQPNPAREAALRRLENSIKSTSVFTEDGPLLSGLLQSARSSNPGVPESTWQALRPEFASSINASLQNDGGETLAWLRTSFAQLSDFELERVAQIYEDPVFAKAQQSLVSAVAQQSALRRNFVNVRLISSGINSVLLKHGMKEAR